MRNPARIPGVVAALMAAWTAHPDQRLGQLVFWAADGCDPFYIEDDVIIERLYTLAKPHPHEGATP